MGESEVVVSLRSPHPVYAGFYSTESQDGGRIRHDFTRFTPLEGGCVCIETNRRFEERFGALSYSHTSLLRGVKCVKRPALLRFRVPNGRKSPCKLYRGVAA